jgi:mono/diheme cytochrome c family protein
VLVSACADTNPPTDEKASGGGKVQDDLEIGRSYVDDRAFRRAALERSLLDRNNGYATLRLANYATEGRWETLPELQHRTAKLVFRDGSRTDTEPTPVWSGEVAWTRTALLELGRVAFERWPAQPMPALEFASATSDTTVLDVFGAWRDADGWLGGLVVTEYAAGATVVTATCATCHARVGERGNLEHGPASRIDLGGGPGKVDVTADAIDNPVAISDLRATRTQRRLHWSGNLENSLPALAVRIETLLITNAGQLARPPREVAFALALYVQALGELNNPLERSEPGARLFDVHCRSCHQGDAGQGDWVSIADVGADPSAAQSSDRGTGGYRVPSLRFASDRTHLTHEAFTGALSDFLDSGRLNSYGAHRFGFELSSSERTDLVSYLSSL